MNFKENMSYTCMLQLKFIKQSTAAGVAGARGARAAPPVASD